MIEVTKQKFSDLSDTVFSEVAPEIEKMASEITPRDVKIEVSGYELYDVVKVGCANSGRSITICSGRIHFEDYHDERDSGNTELLKLIQIALGTRSILEEAYKSRKITIWVDLNLASSSDKYKLWRSTQKFLNSYEYILRAHNINCDIRLCTSSKNEDDAINITLNVDVDGTASFYCEETECAVTGEKLLLPDGVTCNISLLDSCVKLFKDAIEQ